MLYQRGKKKVYYMDFWVAGIRVNKSTGKYTEKEAKKVEDDTREKLEKDILSGEYNRVKMTLIQGFNRCYAEKWKYNKDSEKPTERAKKICAVLGADTYLECLRQEDLQKLIKSLEEKGNKVSTINRYMSTLQVMLNMALNDWKEIKEMPIKFKRYKESKGRIREISEQEEKQVLKYFQEKQKNMDMADLIIVLADTGCRLSEILNLKSVDVDLTQKMIRIWENKGDLPRSVPMTSRVLEVLEKRGNKVFKGVSVDYAEKQWQKCREYMKLQEDKQFVLHAFRHTCASRLVKGGASLRFVQVWLGHHTYTMTERYAHLQSDNLVECVGILERKN